MDPEITGAVLKKWRLKTGIQQKDLAEASGLTPSVVGSLLRGERLPHGDELVRMCLGMEADVVAVFTECCNAYLGKLLELEALQLAQKGQAAKPPAERFFVAEIEKGLESIVAGARSFLPLLSAFHHFLRQSDQFLWLQPPQAEEPAPAPAKPRGGARASSKRTSRKRS